MLDSKALILSVLAIVVPATAAGQRVHVLVRGGDMGGLERLLSCDADLVHATDSTGATPLHVAAALGNADAVRLLLANGADPDARDGRGLTPLHFAAGSLHATVVRALLRAGANPTARPAPDWPSPTDLAFLAEAYRGGTRVTSMLIESGGTLAPEEIGSIRAPRWLVAELAGNPEMVELLRRQAPRRSAAVR